MPNWVFNQVTITGDAKSIAEVKGRLAAPTPKREASPFSFWNIVAPTDLDRYEKSVGSSDKENYEHEDNWYNWNNRNWGTKWDASDPNMVHDTAEEIAYEFDTAWSPPIPAMVQLSEQYPSLTIKIRFTEEQGWGGIIQLKEGEEDLLDEWDIPETHAEDEKIYGECRNCENGDPEYLYADCPR